MSETEYIRPSMRSQSAWILSAKVVGFVISALLPLLIVRYLTPHNVGIYRQAFLVIANAGVVLPMGFSMSAYYFLNRDSEKRPFAIVNILLFNFVVGGIAFSVLFFRPQLLGILFQNDDLTALAPVVGVAIWLLIFSNFLEIAAFANQEARLGAIFIVTAQFTKAVFMTGAVLMFATVEAFVYAVILQSALQTCVLLIYLNQRYPQFWKSFDWTFFREQVVYALPFGFASLLYTSQTDIHNYFVSHKVSPAEFAIYAQGCFQIPLIWILYESITAVVIPRMSELQARGEKREMLLITIGAMRRLAFAYFPLFVFLSIVADVFITTLFTRNYAGSVPIFRINLILLPFFCIMVDPIGRAFKEMGRFLLKLRFVIVVALVCVLYLAIDRVDLRGIISIVVVAVLAEMFASVWKSLKILEVKRRDFYLLKEIAKTGVAALVSGAVFLLVYLAAKDRLMEFCAFFSKSILTSQRGSEFFGGVLFLGICFVIYALLYLTVANLSGLIESEDRNKVVGIWRKISIFGTV